MGVEIRWGACDILLFEDLLLICLLKLISDVIKLQSLSPMLPDFPIKKSELIFK